MADNGGNLRARLESATEGLVYTSESDRPFEFFSFGRVPASALTTEGFGKLVGAPQNARIDERTLDDFLMRHLETSDPYDTRAQQIRPRYERLKAVLHDELRDIRVYRVGTVEVSCFIVGIDLSGNAAGLKTIAIET